MDKVAIFERFYQQEKKRYNVSKRAPDAYMVQVCEKKTEVILEKLKKTSKDSRITLINLPYDFYVEILPMGYIDTYEAEELLRFCRTMESLGTDIGHLR
jgi:hypothetical protein